MNQLDQYERTPLHYLCIDVPKENREKILQAMLEAESDVNRQDGDGWSPLHFAAQEGDSNIAQLLIESGASISATDLNGNTPLWVAALNSYSGTEVVEVLLKHGADPRQKNNHGISPEDLGPNLFPSAI